MSDRPHALRIVDAIQACLADITVANGYHTDAGKNVFRGREDLFGEDQALPCLSIFEDEETSDESKAQPEMQRYATDVRYVVLGVTAADPQNPLDAGHLLKADIQRALFRRRNATAGARADLLGGTVRQFVYLASAVVPRGDGGRLTEAAVKCKALYSLNASDPNQ